MHFLNLINGLIVGIIALIGLLLFFRNIFSGDPFNIWCASSLGAIFIFCTLIHFLMSPEKPLNKEDPELKKKYNRAYARYSLAELIAMAVICLISGFVYYTYIIG